MAMRGMVEDYIIRIIRILRAGGTRCFEQLK